MPRKAWLLWAAVALLLLAAAAGRTRADETTAQLEARLPSVAGRERVDLLNALARSQWGVSSDKAIDWAQQAAALAHELGYDAGEANALRNVGIGHWYRDEYDLALDHSQRAERIFERLGDDAGVAATRSTIGTIYLNLERFDEARAKYLEALRIAEKIGDQYRVGMVRLNLGTVGLGQKRYDDALSELQRALPILEQKGSELDVMTCLGNIAGALRRLDRLREALAVEERILELATHAGSKVRLADALTDIGEIEIGLEHYDRAADFLARAKALAEQENLRRNLQDTQLVLVKLAKARGDYRAALAHHERYSEVRDSVFSAEGAKKVADLQVRFDTEKKEREIRIQRLEIEKQRATRNALAGISLLVAALAVLSYGRYRAKRRTAELFEKLSRTDPLTGLANRRALLELLEHERQRVRRQPGSFAVVLLDVDHFKQFNDRHGHEVGDRVLVGVAGALRSGARAVDLAARWGGEEFLVLLPNSDATAAQEAAARLRERVRGLEIAGTDGPLKVTATFGVAASRDGEDADALLRRADAALYRGKQSGRDRVIVD